MKEKQYEEFTIGGLKDGISLTHMIIYKIPYVDRGEQMHITLGLSQQLPVDTLIGLPFQRATKMSIDLESMKARSGLLKDEYDLAFKQPSRTPIEQIAASGSEQPVSLTTHRE